MDNLQKRHGHTAEPRTCNDDRNANFDISKSPCITIHYASNIIIHGIVAHNVTFVWDRCFYFCCFRDNAYLLTLHIGRVDAALGVLPQEHIQGSTSSLHVKPRQNMWVSPVLDHWMLQKGTNIDVPFISSFLEKGPYKVCRRVINAKVSTIMMTNCKPVATSLKNHQQERVYKII